MKACLLFLAVAACAHGVLGSLKGGLRVRFGMGVDIGTSFFYDIPRSVPAAESEGWTRADRPKGPLPELLMYCPNDHVLCGLYDDTDYIAGLQIGISQDDFSDGVFDWHVQGYTNWTADVDGTPKNFWTIQQYFVSEEFLNKSKEDRLAARNPNKTLQDDGVWMTGFYGNLLKISTNADDIANNSPFTEQSCIPWMGLHYFYNMTTSTECTSDGIYPWFPMVDSGELIAAGFITFGKIATKEGARNWFEDPETSVVKMIVPRGPECLYDMVDTYGVVTMHIYYVEEPWLIQC